MAKTRWVGVSLIGVFTTLALVALLIPLVALAGHNESALPAAIPPPDGSLFQSLESAVAQDLSGSSLSGSLLQQSPTLAVSIVSSPWAVLDHNDPGGSGGPAPGVFVVEAVITSTGTVTDLIVSLDYGDDPLWVLLDGEYPTRTIPSLAEGAAYHAYWFAEYPAIIGASHRYTVTADAHNAIPATTSENYYGNPELGQTVKTRSFQGTGNSGVIRASHDATVGAVHTITVEYDLGTNPEELLFSPVGNPDFEPSNSRLLASTVLFLGSKEMTTTVVHDRLHFPAVPRLPNGSLPDRAKVTYQFILLTPSHNCLCPYNAAGYGTTYKYDQFYCQPEKDTVVCIEGTLPFSLTKQASGDTVQQNDVLTYTLHYTNNGTTPLMHAWVWDDMDTAIGSVITTTIDPPSAAKETTDSRVAWYLDRIGPGSTGTLTFTVLIDGQGQDLADHGTDQPCVFRHQPGQPAAECCVDRHPHRYRPGAHRQHRQGRRPGDYRAGRCADVHTAHHQYRLRHSYELGHHRRSARRR